MVQSSSFSAASRETAICPQMLKGFTTLCIVTFLHSRSLQSAWAENRISWQTGLLFHCRRYTCGSLKEIIMYSSSDGTFLSEINGCRYCGGAVEKTNRRNSNWDEPIFYGNKERMFKLFTFWLPSSLFAVEKIQTLSWRHYNIWITIWYLPMKWFCSIGMPQTYSVQSSHSLSHTKIWSQKTRDKMKRRQISNERLCIYQPNLKNKNMTQRELEKAG